MEYGFLDNINDANRLKNNYKNYVDAVVNAILSYVNRAEIIYIVKKGDSLYSIAQKYNTTVQEIKSLNNLTSNNLNIGQKILIPFKVEESLKNTYIVKQGDSLYSIAQKYNTTVQEIKSLNNLTSNNLNIGQTLKLPVKEIEITVPLVENTYTVKQGDSLYSIAQKYNTTVTELKEINDLISNDLSIGQVLVVPIIEETIDYELYTVKKGDSLYSIAQKYNTTVTELKDVNNLIDNNLSIGEILKIPVEIKDTGKIYTVGKGDSLYSIAKKYGISYQELKELNNLTSNMLSIGQKLIVP